MTALERNGAVVIDAIGYRARQEIAAQGCQRVVIARLVE